MSELWIIFLKHHLARLPKVVKETYENASPHAVLANVYSHNRKISDNGVGIASDQLDKVMNLFYSTKGGGGSIRGSGLYYCVTLIQKHHGEIRIHSKPDMGTTVDIMLPLSPKPCTSPFN